MKKSVKIALVLLSLCAASTAFGWGWYGNSGYYGNYGYGCSTCNYCDSCGYGGFWY